MKKCSTLHYLHTPQYSTVQGVCKLPFFVLLLHAYSYAPYTVDREIFILRIIPIEDFFMVLNFLICEIFNS